MQVSSKPAASLVAACPPGSRILFVSPHFDDVAFSCAGLVHHLVSTCETRVVWATVFSHGRPRPQGFALRCQTTKGIPREVDYMAIRRQEDRNCGVLLKIEEAINLGFLEAPHRGYRSAKKLFGPLLRHDEQRLLRAVGQALARLACDLSAYRVIAPLGLGGHVDHVLVSRAAEMAFAPARLLYYADSPYLLRCSRSDLRSRTLGMTAHVLDVGAVSAERAAAYACYASQLDYQLRDIGNVHDLAQSSARHAGDLCRSRHDVEIYLRRWPPRRHPVGVFARSCRGTGFRVLTPKKGAADIEAVNASPEKVILRVTG
ncbi:PIG-L family deacetylase [Marinobacter sp. P4B1]|uniref:PIG-L deacetylase family protein n=1 Tax=Marinobacter sp. P4B1 TaxID=1119533 RepID=UPI0009EAC128